MNLIESTPQISNFVKLEPNLKFAQYMGPKGLQYCDVILRVPLSAAEIQETEGEENPDVD